MSATLNVRDALAYVGAAELILLAIEQLHRWTPRRLRIRLGLWILGEGFAGSVARLWLVHERAKAAVSESGHVVLAKCEPLAEALYAPIPGNWRLSVERIENAPGDVTP
jgi:hypothetical protein